MRRSALVRIVLSGALLLSGTALSGAPQAPPPPGANRALSIAIDVRSPRGLVEEIDTRIAQMLAAGQLLRTYEAVDRLAGNRRHEYYRQVHQGVPVEGGGVSRQLVSGTTVSAFGTLYLGIDLTVGPRLAMDVATMTVRETAGAAVAPDSTTLVVLPAFDGSYRLTYRATFTDGKVRFIDAVTGDVARIDDAFTHQRAIGTGEGAHGDRRKISTVLDNGAYEAVDQFRPAQIRTRSTQDTNTRFEDLFSGAGVTATDADNVWVNPSVVDAHANAGLAYDYFHQQAGWQGLDGANSAIDQVVTDGFTLENNAFFAPPSSAASSVGLLAFGVSSAGYPMATLDVVGHEVMHGVTFFSLRSRTGSGLGSGIIPDGLGPTEASFGGQALSCNTTVLRFADGSTAPFLCSGGQYVLTSNHGGAINEGFSDVFGTAIEFQFHPPGNAALRADYILGEDAGPGGSASTLVQGLSRSLADPGSLPVESTGVVRYPDHMDRRVRFAVYVRNNFVFVAPYAIVDGRFINVSTDSGGVHFNATLMGHVFYRAVEGGTHRTSGREVAGVGVANRGMIEQIFFRAMTVLMPATTTFSTTASVLRQAAIDLYGSSSAAYRAIDESLQASGL